MILVSLFLKRIFENNQTVLLPGKERNVASSVDEDSVEILSRLFDCFVTVKMTGTILVM